MERADTPVRVLGPTQLGAARLPVAGEKATGTLALLCIAQGQSVSTDAIADMLWADDPPATADTALRVHISRLRKLGERAGLPSLITRSATGYRLGVESGDVDAVRFETAVVDARTQPPEVAAETLRTALALWSGEPFAGAPDHDTVNAERRRLTELRLTAVEDRCARRAEFEAPGTIVDELFGLAEAEPFRERRTDLAARALYGAGRQAEALRLIARTSARLRDELGLDPGPELVALEGRILRHDPELVAPQAPSVRAWRIREPPASPPLVGRAEVLADLLGAATAPGRPAVSVLIGPPGIGKTRVLAECATALPATALYGGCAGGGPLQAVLQVLVNGLAHGRLGVDDLPAPVTRVLVGGDRVMHGAETTSLAFAAADVIEALATRERLVVLVDDAHALDDASELALRAVLDSGAPIELVFASWPSELDASEAWKRLRSRWPLHCDVHTVALDPLTRVELMDLAGVAALAVPDDAGVRLATMSGGNPYVALAALRTGSVSWRGSSAPSQDEVLGRFLADRSPEEVEMLQLLALSDGGCPVDVVGAVRRLDVLWWLEGERLVAVDDGVARVGHDLLLAAVLQRIGDGHRRALRAELAGAEAAEQAPRWRQRRALHLLDGGHGPDATAELLAAADEALAEGRFDLASAIADQWLDGLGAGTDQDADDEMRTILALAVARSGDLGRAIAILDDVERSAAARGDLDRRIATATRLADIDRMVMAGGDPVPLLDRVLPDIPDDRTEDRVRVAALLLLHLSSPNRRAQHTELARQVVETAHPDDPRLELQALSVRHRALSQQPDVGARVAVTDRVLLLADAVGSERVRFQALLMALSNEVRSGDHEAARHHADLLTAVTERAAEPIWRWHDRLVAACLAEIRQPGSGDALAAEAARLGRRYGIPDAAEAAGVWTFLRAYASGTIASLGEMARAAAVRDGNPAWATGAALCLGDRDLLVEGWDRRDVLDGTGIWLVHCCMSLEAAARLGDTRVLEEARAVVAPFTGQWAVLGSASSCFGPVDRFLALAAEGAERDRLFEAARAQAVGVSSATWQTVIDRDAAHTGPPARIGSS